jgi:hypothetical protein
VYLRKLSGSLKADDPGWDVPWIGMDSSALPRIIFFLSTVLFPVLGLVLLAGRTAARLTRGYGDTTVDSFRLHSILTWHWSVKAKIIFLIVAVLLSALLGILSWHYRPKLEPQEPPAPTPLFY